MAGRPTNRDSWPDSGPRRDLVAHLDRVREDNGRKSLREIAAGVNLTSATRVNGILRALSLPVDEEQVKSLARALGGAEDDAERAGRLYRRAAAAPTAEGRRPKPVVVGTLPRLPATYVPRETLADEMAERVRRSLAGGGDVVAFVGMGGAGKTTTAVAVARQVASSHGSEPLRIVFTSVGRASSPAQAQRRLAAALGSDAQFGEDPEVGRARLAGLMTGVGHLVVLDDVWTMEQVRALTDLGPQVTILMTTRDRSLARSVHAHVVPVEELPLDLARVLLARWVGIDVEELPGSADALCVEAGNLALAVAMIGARVGIDGGGSTWGRPWQDSLDALRAADPAEVAADFADYEHPTLLKAVRVSLDALSVEARRRYLELAVLDDRPFVPATAAEALWSGAGLTGRHARALLRDLADRSLLRLHDDETFDLHDVQALVARHLQAKEPGGLPAAHRRLIRGYLEPESSAGEPGLSPSLPSVAALTEDFPDAATGNALLAGDDGYFLNSLVHHLLDAGEADESHRLLISSGWLLIARHRRQLTDLLSDYGQMPDDAVVRRIGQALQLSLHVLQDDPDQIAGQLLARLPVRGEDEIAGLLRDIARWTPGPWLRPLRASLQAPGGALTYTLVHETVVTAAAVAGDETAVTGDGHGTIRLWDLNTGRLRHRLSGHRCAIAGIVAVDHGSRVITVSDDAVCRWNVHSGRREGRLVRDGDVGSGTAAIDGSGRLVATAGLQEISLWQVPSFDPVGTIAEAWAFATAFDLDGQRLVVASSGGDVSVWDVASRTCVHRMSGHAAAISVLRLANSGGWAFTGSTDRTVRQWDLDNGRERLVFAGHEETISVLGVDRAGRRLVSCDHSGAVLWWDVESGSLVARTHQHSDSVVAVALDTATDAVATGSVDGDVRVWGLTDGGLRHTLRAHTARITSVAMVPGRSVVLTSSWDKTARIWDLARSGEQTVAARRSPVETLAAASSIGVSAGQDGTIDFWDLASGRPRRGDRRHGHLITGLAISRNGRRAISTAPDGSTYVWATAEASCTSELVAPMLGSYPRDATALALDDGGRWASVGYIDGLVILWDLDRDAEVHRWEGHRGMVSSLQIRGDMVVSASWDRSVRIWDRRSTDCRHVLADHPTRIDMVEVTTGPDGSADRCVAACADGTVVVWDVQTGDGQREFATHPGKIGGLAITNDGLLATGGWDGQLRVWRVDSGTLVAEARVGGRVNDVVASGGTVVTGTENGQVSAWSTTTGELLTRWDADASITCLAVGGTSNDGTLLAAGDSFGTVHLLSLLQPDR